MCCSKAFSQTTWLWVNTLLDSHFSIQPWAFRATETNLRLGNGAAGPGSSPLLLACYKQRHRLFLLTFTRPAADTFSHHLIWSIRSIKPQPITFIWLSPECIALPHWHTHTYTHTETEARAPRHYRVVLVKLRAEDRCFSLWSISGVWSVGALRGQCAHSAAEHTSEVRFRRAKVPDQRNDWRRRRCPPRSGQHRLSPSPLPRPFRG